MGNIKITPQEELERVGTLDKCAGCNKEFFSSFFEGLVCRECQAKHTKSLKVKLDEAIKSIKRDRSNKVKNR